MSYRNFGLAEGLGGGDWGRKGGRYLMNKRWEGLVNCEKLPELAVTAVAVNNNGNEVAVGCANGNVRVYDLSR